MTHQPDDLDGQIRIFTPGEYEEPDSDEVEREPRPELTTVIESLKAGEYPRSVLVGLSDISPREAEQLHDAWSEVDVDVRRGVVSELHDLAEERVDYLFHRALLTMLDDPEAAVRQLALAGLWEHADPRFATKLVSMLTEDPSEDVRAEAARGLARFVDMVALGELEGDIVETIPSTLLGVLENENESLHVRARSLESVSVLGQNEDVHVAIERFFEEDDTGFRATALYAMGRSLNARYLPAILNETASDDAEIRFEAARAAGRIGDTSALPVLADLADDEDAEVRHASINALGEIGGRAAVRYLRRIAEAAPEADQELVDEALEEASIVTDPLLLEDEQS